MTSPSAKRMQPFDDHEPAEVDVVEKRGLLVINADDWGFDQNTTDRISECVCAGRVHAVSGMVFMEDSERAAAIARESGTDVGLHLNLTAPFTAPHCPPDLKARQQKITAYLRRNRLAQVVFHPGLRQAFEYVVAAQIDDFFRLYGAKPTRFDGHHHMHLCANVLLGGLLPRGSQVRRNFSFNPGEKSIVNRFYRRLVDGILAREHNTTDFLFAIMPMDLERLRGIFSLAQRSVVEVETHPVNADEYRFLMSDDLSRWTDACSGRSCFTAGSNSRG